MSEKYEFIDAEQATVTATGDKKYTITVMCAWLGVSTSGYDQWRDRPESATALRRHLLTLLVKKAFEESDETYGHRRIHAQLGRWGEHCSPELVCALLREQGLAGVSATTVAAHPDRGRPLRRPDPGPGVPGFHRRGPRAENGGRYHRHSHVGGLALSRDRHRRSHQGRHRVGDGRQFTRLHSSRRRSSWQRGIIPSNPVRSSTPTGAATTHRPRSPTPSPRWNCASRSARTGSCFDNAMAELFFGALKNELVHRTVYPTREHTRRDIARYVEVRYNTQRLHSGLGYKTPLEVHNEYLNRQQTA